MHVWFFKQALLTWQTELNLVVFYIRRTKGCCVEKVVWNHPSCEVLGEEPPYPKINELSGETCSSLGWIRSSSSTAWSVLGSYARSPWAAGRRSGWRSTVSPVSCLSLEEILPASQGRELHQSPRETVWIMVCTTKLVPHRSRPQMRWFIEVSIRVPKTCFSIQTYVWPIYMSLPAAALAKHVTVQHQNILGTRSYKHLALMPAQERGPVAVQAKCSGSGIYPFHSGWLSRKTNLGVDLDIKTLGMAMMLF